MSVKSRTPRPSREASFDKMDVDDGGNQTWGPAGNFCFLPVTVTNQGYDRPLVYHDNPGLKPGEW